MTKTSQNHNVDLQFTVSALSDFLSFIARVEHSSDFIAFFQVCAMLKDMGVARWKADLGTYSSFYWPLFIIFFLLFGVMSILTDGRTQILFPFNFPGVQLKGGGRAHVDFIALSDFSTSSFTLLLFTRSSSDVVFNRFLRMQD